VHSERDALASVEEQVVSEELFRVADEEAVRGLSVSGYLAHHRITLLCESGAGGQRSRHDHHAERSRTPAGVNGQASSIFPNRPASPKVAGGKLSGKIGPLEVQVYELR
jgi:hypothetical protein